MESDIKTDALHTLANMSKLEQKIAIGTAANPGWKTDETVFYLGELRERVLRRLTIKQVSHTFIYPEIQAALNHIHFSRMLINGNLSDQFTDKYIALALQFSKSYTVVEDPHFEGDTGLIVISDEAVNVEDIDV